MTSPHPPRPAEPRFEHEWEPHPIFERPGCVHCGCNSYDGQWSPSEECPVLLRKALDEITAHCDFLDAAAAQWMEEGVKAHGERDDLRRALDEARGEVEEAVAERERWKAWGKHIAAQERQVVAEQVAKALAAVEPDAALGRALREAREAWGDPNLRTHRWGSAEYDDWYVYTRNAGHSGDRVVGRADSELEALRAALQAAPGAAAEGGNNGN